jgi:fumarate reductase flavoprotein subunit
MKVIETDIAIIGGGTAGLGAAVAAAERGARVTVIEKASTTGGTGNMSQGPFAVGSRYQRNAQPPLDRDLAFKIFMEYTHWRVDARLVRNYIDKSADTIDWLVKMGVEFCEAENQFEGAYATHHCVKLPTGGTGYQVGAIMMTAMTNKARELGAQILLRTTAKKILKEGNRVTGVLAEDSSGEEIRVKAKAVFVGTGGFGDNPEMIKKYTPYEYGHDMFSMRVPGMMGEGLLMAWEAGAAQSQTTMHLIFSLPPPYNGRGGAREELAFFRQPNLIVNILGERFVNEQVIANTTYLGNAIQRQKNHFGFAIFDNDTKLDYEKNGMHFCDPATVKSIDANIEQVIKEGCDCVYVADTLEELATKTGIDLQGLRQTLIEYNHMCEMSSDPFFNKDSQYLHPVRTPKFYAAKLVPSAYGSLGGIKINYKLEVLNKNEDVIPGFYAAGVDVNTIYNDSYIYILPGNTLGFALNSGRMAGENSADYVKSLGK